MASRIGDKPHSAVDGQYLTFFGTVFYPAGFPVPAKIVVTPWSSSLEPRGHDLCSIIKSFPPPILPPSRLLAPAALPYSTLLELCSHGQNIPVCVAGLRSHLRRGKSFSCLARQVDPSGGPVLPVHWTVPPCWFLFKLYYSSFGLSSAFFCFLRISKTLPEREKSGAKSGR